MVRASFDGTADSVVVSMIADIVVNHFADITVSSISGNYIPLILRVISNQNRAFIVQGRVGNGFNSPSMPLNVEVFPLSGETITFDSITQISGASESHTHYGLIGGQRISGSNGLNDGLEEAGSLSVMGRIGIGTSSNTNWNGPQAKLHINNQTSALSMLVEDSANVDATPFVISASGDVSVGTASGIEKFNVFGNIYVSSSTTTKINLVSSAVNTYIASEGSGSAFGSLSNHPVVFYQNNSEKARIDLNGNVGINVTTPNSKLHVRSSVANSDTLRVDGVSGELFTVTDNLIGSLFSVNDISGIPVFEAFSDNTINLGDFQAPALFTSTKSIKGPSLTNQVIYQVSSSLYTSAFFDYNVTSGQKTRTGTIMAVWNSTTIEFTETGTMDLPGGDTSGISLTVDISGANIRLLSTTGVTDTWTIKVIIRAI